MVVDNVIKEFDKNRVNRETVPITLEMIKKFQEWKKRTAHSNGDRKVKIQATDHLARYLLYRYGKRDVYEVTYEDIIELFEMLKEERKKKEGKPLRLSTIRNYTYGLKEFFKFVAKFYVSNRMYELIDYRDFVSDTDLDMEKRERVRIPGINEIRTNILFLRTLHETGQIKEETRDLALFCFVFMTLTGARYEEMLRLKVADINEHFIRLIRNKKKVRETYIPTHPQILYLKNYIVNKYGLKNDDFILMISYCSAHVALHMSILGSTDF